MHCQNCGQTNLQASNFCRFCGTKYTQVQYSNANNYQPANNFDNNKYEYAPPRPYSWKTDEFQISDRKQLKNDQLNGVQPLANFKTPQNIAFQSFQQPAAMTHNYHCPQCSSQLFPRIVRQISTGGWIVFAIFLVAFFPLFWVGLLIKDETRVCPVCNLKLS